MSQQSELFQVNRASCNYPIATGMLQRVSCVQGQTQSGFHETSLCDCACDIRLSAFAIIRH